MNSDKPLIKIKVDKFFTLMKHGVQKAVFLSGLLQGSRSRHSSNAGLRKQYSPVGSLL